MKKIIYRATPKSTTRYVVKATAGYVNLQPSQSINIFISNNVSIRGDTSGRDVCTTQR